MACISTVNGTMHYYALNNNENILQKLGECLTYNFESEGIGESTKPSF